MNNLLRLSLLLCLLLPCGACRALGLGKMSAAEQRSWRDGADAHLESAAAKLSKGEEQQALDELADLWSVPGLSLEQRNQTYALLEKALDAQLGADDSAALDAGRRPQLDSDDLEDLWERDLPRRLRVRAGIACAEALLADGERMDSFRQVRAVDDAYATHEARARAGAVVAEAGLSMASDAGHYFLFFAYRSRAPEILEYLVLHYPAEPRCDLAYLTLAQIYEEEDELDLALERRRELVLYHPGSPFALESELAIPRLRLQRSESWEYDRQALLEARQELEGWVQRHAQDQRPAAQALLEQAQALLLTAREQLCESDLSIARFYLKIRQAEGARLHAQRASEQAPDEGRQGAAQELLGKAERLRLAQEAAP